MRPRAYTVDIADGRGLTEVVVRAYSVVLHVDVEEAGRARLGVVADDAHAAIPAEVHEHHLGSRSPIMVGALVTGCNALSGLAGAR